MNAAASVGGTTCIDYVWQAGYRNFSDTNLDDNTSVSEVLESKRAIVENPVIDYTFY